jgi:hypothetical protein
LPRRSARLCTATTVLSLVCRPRTISTSFITGTGFMKCMPATSSGRLVCAASQVMDRLEVLLTRSASFGNAASASRSSFAFNSRCSVAASMARSASA